MSTKLKANRLSMQEITEISKKSESLYILNMSRTLEPCSPVGGDVIIPIKVGEDTMHVVVPNTWIPWDVGSSIATKEVVNNTVFRRYISRGMLAAISIEDAQKILKEDSAKIELNNVNERLNHIHRNLNISATTSKDIEIELGMRMPTIESKIGSEEVGTREEGVAGVGAIAVEIVNRDDIDKEQRYAMILSSVGTFNKKDWNYLLERVTDDDRIKILAKKYEN